MCREVSQTPGTGRWCYAVEPPLAREEMLESGRAGVIVLVTADGVHRRWRQRECAASHATIAATALASSARPSAL